MVFLFCFWENVLLFSYTACYVIYSSRKAFKQPFTDVLQNPYKIDVLKNFAIFTANYLCWNFLIKLRAWMPAFSLKRDSHRGFFLWILRHFLEQFFYRTPPVYYTFLKFHVMIEFFGRLRVQNWYFPYFLFHWFVFLHNSSVWIGCPLLFRTYFHTSIFSKCNFRRH